MNSDYHHRQIGYLILIITFIVIGIFAAFTLSMDDFLPLSIMVVVILILLNFSTLTVHINQDRIKLHFGPGLIRKEIPLDQVRQHAIVSTPWYWGYGIRFYPGGMIWNVSGTKAVEIYHQDGRRFRIGTDDPEGLSKALTTQIGELPPLSPEDEEVYA